LEGKLADDGIRFAASWLLVPLANTHRVGFNLSLTHPTQTYDRISRYFKAKISALNR
jgi:hypothetical protein